VTKDGTPRAIGPIAEQVLAWVAMVRNQDHAQEDLDHIRRIELCALAAREAAMFFDLYGLTPDGTWKSQEC